MGTTNLKEISASFPAQLAQQVYQRSPATSTDAWSGMTSNTTPLTGQRVRSLACAPGCSTTWEGS